MNKMTFEDDYGIYSIESKESFDNILDVVDSLIIPILRAAGYAEASIEKLWNDHE